jgi:hypothetical protein
MLGLAERGSEGCRVCRRDTQKTISPNPQRGHLAELPRQPGRRHPEPHPVLLDAQRAGVAVQQQPDRVALLEGLLLRPVCPSFRLIVEEAPLWQYSPQNSAS